MLGAFHASKPSDLLAELQGRLPIRVTLKGLTEVFTLPEYYIHTHIYIHTYTHISFLIIYIKVYITYTYIYTLNNLIIIGAQYFLLIII